MKPLLITTATRPPNGVYVLKMTTIEKRVLLTKAAIFFWANLGIDKIVIADATESIILGKEELKLLAGIGTQVEQLCYRQNDQAVIEKGKGFGEGALMKFALETSNFLRDEEHFYKCTGKVYCRNFEEIATIIQQNNLQSMFWQEPLQNRIDTRFFYTSKDFCEQLLLPAYEKIDDRKGIFSEHVVYELANSKLVKGNSVRPLLSGFSGSLDTPYFDKGLGFLDFNYPCWIAK